MDQALKLQPWRLAALPNYPGTGMGGSDLTRDQGNQYSPLGGLPRPGTTKAISPLPTKTSSLFSLFQFPCLSI